MPTMHATPRCCLTPTSDCCDGDDLSGSTKSSPPVSGRFAVAADDPTIRVDEVIRPPGGCDPFFREIDAVLAVQRARDTEHRIRRRARQQLFTAIFDPWLIGSDDAQRIEMRSAQRIIQESCAREGVKL